MGNNNKTEYAKKYDEYIKNYPLEFDCNGDTEDGWSWGGEPMSFEEFCEAEKIEL